MNKIGCGLIWLRRYIDTTHQVNWQTAPDKLVSSPCELVSSLAHWLTWWAGYHCLFSAVSSMFIIDVQSKLEPDLKEMTATCMQILIHTMASPQASLHPLIPIHLLTTSSTSPHHSGIGQTTEERFNRKPFEDWLASEVLTMNLCQERACWPRTSSHLKTE